MASSEGSRIYYQGSLRASHEGSLFADTACPLFFTGGGAQMNNLHSSLYNSNIK